MTTTSIPCPMFRQPAPLLVILFLLSSTGLASCFSFLNGAAAARSRLPSGGSSLLASTSDENLECAALLPGQVVQVVIGDVSSGEGARKAWKKRRRSGSPLLLPCTVVGLDRKWMVINNVMTILNKYGNPMALNGDPSSSSDVALPVGKICTLSERDYGMSLRNEAQCMGYDRVGDLFIDLFDDHVKNQYGTELIRGLQDNLVLVSALSRRHARELARKACLAHVSESGDGAGTPKRMLHMGTAKIRQSAGANSRPQFATESLSAAIRIKQEDARSNRIKAGEECNAFVFGYDATGDNGSPLLTLAIDPPPRNLVKRRQSKRANIGRRNSRQAITTERKLDDLKVGERLRGTVVAVSTHSGAAFLDCSVLRQQGKRHGGGTTRVIGMLRFDDLAGERSVQDGRINEDSVIQAAIDDQNEITIIEDLPVEDFEAEWNEASEESELLEDGDVNEVGEADEEFSGLHPQDRLQAIGRMLEAEADEVYLNPQRIKAGDELDVFVKAISPQSGRFMVTLNSSIANKTAKQIKLESTAQKRMSKLADKFGGCDGLERIEELAGTECTGVIKAVSKTGDWFYVQPILDQDEMGENSCSLPVGVASIGESSDGNTGLLPGNEVRLRLDGIDEERGQVAMTILL